MVPGQDARAQFRGRFLGAAFGRQQGFLGGGFALLVGVVGAVEFGEALEVVGGPGVFALQQLVDFALGAGTLAYGEGVVGFCFL